jgi:DNA polymerase-3 subunit gamma/tau
LPKVSKITWPNPKHNMSNFVVSARKYRPIRFDSVVGQAHITNTLKNAIRNNHLAHAFLFCGPRGVGKTTCARILAKVLNCEQPTSETEPCDVCPSCKAFNENASLNIHELDAASNNSVEHIRALIEQVRFAPQRGKYKIYIIDEVHMLSQAAFNAFLKTLEEPPSYAIFILATTEKHKIIPTILSRCQIFDFNRIQISDMAGHLRNICNQEGISAEEDALNIIAQKADGALRDALSIYDRIVSFSGNNIKYQDVIENLNILDYDYYFRVVDSIVSENVSELMLIFDSIQRKGFDGEIFINGLAEHLRNLLVCQRPETAALLEVSGNIKERYLQQASLVPTSIIVSALSLASDCDINYKMSRNKRLHVEMSLIKMAFIKQAINQAGFPSANDGNEKKNYKLNNPADENAYTNHVEQKLAQKTQSPIVELAETEEEYQVKAEAVEDNNQPIAEKESIISKFKHKKGNLLDNLISEVEEDKIDYHKSSEIKDWKIEILQEFWDEYCNEIDSPSTQVLYKGAILEIRDGIDQLFVTVKSSRAKDAISRDNALLEKVRKTFSKSHFQFSLEIEEGPVEEIVKPKAKPVSDRDKYSYFMQMNPLLAEFQKRFGLYPADYNPKKK